MPSQDSPPVLNYVPQLYRHRHIAAAGWAVYTVVVIVLLLFFDWRHSGPALWVQASIITAMAGLTAYSYAFGNNAECRVEGTQLWFIGARTPATSVPVRDIQAIDRVHSGDESYFEISVDQLGRMRVDLQAFTPLTSLRRVLLDLNPRIRFDERSAATCGCCGVDLLPKGRSTSTREVIRLIRGGECPNCRRPFPRYGVFVV